MTGVDHGSDTPVVSVLTTAYNRERFLGEALDSVLRSTFDDFELIVVDDNSSDGTLAVAKQFAQLDARIRVFSNESTLGDYPNRIRAAAHARGKYLKYLDSDDIIYPHGLEVMVRCMNAYPAAGFGLSAIADSHGPYPRSLEPNEAYREHFLQADLFGRAPGSAIIRKDAFDAVGGFSDQRQIGDYELWLRLAQKFSLVKLPRDLVWDRIHPGQEQHADSDEEKAAMYQEAALAAIANPDTPLTADERRVARARILDGHARAFWLSLLARGGMTRAMMLRRRLAIPVAHLARFAIARGLGRSGTLRDSV